MSAALPPIQRAPSVLIGLALVAQLAACAHMSLDKKQKEERDVHNDLGVAAFKNGHYQEALKEFETTLQIDPDFAFAHAGLGSVYMFYWTGPRIADAKAEFIKATLLDPHYPGAWNNLGTIYADEGDLARASDAFSKALAEPNYDTPWIAQTNLGWILHLQGKSEEGKRLLQQAMVEAGAYCQAHRQFARLLADEGKVEASDKAWDDFAHTCPREPDAAFHEATQLMKKGDQAGAAGWFHTCDQVAGAQPPGDDCRKAFDALPASITEPILRPPPPRKAMEFTAPDQNPAPQTTPLVVHESTTSGTDSDRNSSNGSSNSSGLGGDPK